MSKIASGEVARDLTEKRLTEHRLFIGKRPQYYGVTGILTSTVAACEKSGLRPPMINFEDAHQHIYGENGCVRCRRDYEILRKQERAIYNQKPRRNHSGIDDG